jgi:hypothetical protein
MSMDQPVKHCNGYHDTMSDISFESTEPAPRSTVYSAWKAKPAPRPTPPARCTVKWQDDGLEFLYTVEGDSNQAVFAMLKELKAAIAASRTSHHAPPVATQSPPVPAPEPVSPGMPVDEPASCPIHGTAKLRPSKFGGANLAKTWLA